MTLIGASDFVAEAMDDYSAPTASDFGSRMSSCRHTVCTLEEYLDVDRNILHKIKKAVKAINASGLAHVDSEDALSQALDKFGSTFIERNEVDLGATFTNVAACTKETAALLKNMICNMTNILVFPLESVLKGDFKEVKGELKKPFDKASKDYETKLLKIEKEKRELARQHGMIRNEISGAEIAEDLEKERRMFQLQMCEYLIKVNDINTKKGVDIMHSFVLYFQTQYNFFQDGLKIMDKFKMCIDKAKSMVESPLWKLLSDMEPEQLVSCIDFSYITDALTRAEALEILHKGKVGREARERELMESGFPAYTTSCAWLGYPDAELRQRCTEALQEGWRRFKVKVGGSLEDDERRCTIIRDVIGPECTLMLDANQRWDVLEAVEWTRKLARFRPLWIEEPTSPDDVLGHKRISQALSPLGIGVATGEQCQNRVVFKQLLQAQALQFCQLDTCRLGGIPEILAVLLMACKFRVPVCPHAGGVGLCELAQHVSMFDFLSVSASLDNRVCEYVDHLHEHFVFPVRIQNAAYMPPTEPGYSTEMRGDSVRDFEFPGGRVWGELASSGKHAATMATKGESQH